MPAARTPAAPLTAQNQGVGRESIAFTISIPVGGDAPDFVEVGEAGIAMDDAMRRQRRVQLVG